jgi:hypothetical protein
MTPSSAKQKVRKCRRCKAAFTQVGTETICPVCSTKCKVCGTTLTDTNQYSTRKDLHQYYCKTCISSRISRTRCKTKQKEYDLQRNYGISLDTKSEMFKSQGGRCAICKCTEEEDGKSFCVDHDHKTGRVRGLLCHSCNHGLGKFKDKVTYLAEAIDYLERVPDDSAKL